MKAQKNLHSDKTGMKAFNDSHEQDNAQGLASSFSLTEKSLNPHGLKATSISRRDILTSKLQTLFPPSRTDSSGIRELVASHSGVTVLDSHEVPSRGNER